MQDIPKNKKRKKRTRLQILHDKLWDIYSVYIRLRDKKTCFTCGIRHWDEELGEFSIKGFNAGHFIHNVLDFDEENVHCQCIRCNHHLSGNGVVYTFKMIELYGLAQVEDLRNRATQALAGDIWTVEMYEEKIKHYQEQVQLLQS